jgi:hypothetical protein
MLKLDHLKEEIGYFKFWLGIVVLTDISVLGWVIAAVDGATRVRITLAAIGILVLSFCAAVLHRAIARRLERIGEL